MTLQEAIEIYVARKQSEGYDYAKPERELVSLSRHVGTSSLDHINARQVLTFLDGPKTSPITWERKYNLIRGFFDFWLARGEVHILPLPAKRKTSPRIFIPYIYTNAELRALLKATRTSQQEVWCTIDALTLRTFLIFLYGTGALVGEALRLSTGDIDFKRSAITIRSNRFSRSRTIPIGPDLAKVLQNYLLSKSRTAVQGSSFFLNRSGRELNVSTVSTTFQRLRRFSGIRRHDGASYQPRMHDLRHTFAVHRITSWIRHGADLNRMLPALAVYMGQSGLGSTERYLSLTPERFRTQLMKLSPAKSRKRWRDDAGLMTFLAEL